MKRSWWSTDGDRKDLEGGPSAAVVPSVDDGGWPIESAALVYPGKARNLGDVVEDDEQYALTLLVRDHARESFSKLLGQTLTVENLAERSNNFAAGLLGIGIRLRRDQ